MTARQPCNDEDGGPDSGTSVSRWTPESSFHVSTLESKLYMVSCFGINLILIQTYGTVSDEDYWIITIIPEKIDC
jgi:hypothetical protein